LSLPRTSSVRIAECEPRLLVPSLKPDRDKDAPTDRGARRRCERASNIFTLRRRQALREEDFSTAIRIDGGVDLGFEVVSSHICVGSWATQTTL
jgi:hypothetical protein